MRSVEVKTHALFFPFLRTRIKNLLQGMDKETHNNRRLLRMPFSDRDDRRYIMAYEKELRGPIGAEVRRAWWL